MFQNIITKIVWKSSFCSIHFQWSLNFLEKIITCFKKVNSVKELPKSKRESFLESIFDLNYCLNCLHNTIKFGSLRQLTCLLFSISIERIVWWYTKCQKIKVWRRLGRVRAKNLFSQTILGGVLRRGGEGPAGLGGSRGVWYLLWRVFGLLLPWFGFWGGGCALRCVSTGIFLIFP